MKLNKAIETRKSVRKYKDKKPNWRKILEAIDAARYAPSAGGIFSLKFIVVDDKDKIQKLATASQQDFVGKAQYVVVVCSNPSIMINSYGKSRADRYLRQQAGAAIENFLLTLNEKGLDTCWVGHFVDSQIKRILDIPADTDVEALFPIGIEMGKSKLKRKTSLDSILYFNKYKNKKMKVPKRTL